MNFGNKNFFYCGRVFNVVYTLLETVCTTLINKYYKIKVKKIIVLYTQRDGHPSVHNKCIKPFEKCVKTVVQMIS